MIKETLITLAFGSTLIEKDPLPDIPHKNYTQITQTYNAVFVYGNIQPYSKLNEISNYSLEAILATKSIN